MRDGLPVMTFSAMCQGRDGYLWLGTFDGLVRFDGVRFTVFDASGQPGLTTSRFTDVAADPAGGVWSNSETDGLVHVEDGEVRPIRWQGRPLFACAMGMLADSTGRCLVMTREGVFEIADTAVRRLDAAPAPVSKQPAIRDRSGGAWWLGPKQLTWSRDGVVRRITLPAALCELDVERGWLESADGRLYLRCRGRLWRVADGRIEPGPLAPADVPDAREFVRVSCIAPQLIAPDGAVWDSPGSVVRRNGVPIVDLGTPPDQLFCDRDGTLWAIARNGLHRIARAVVSRVAETFEGQPNNLAVIHQRRDGTIWLVGTEFLIARWDGSGLRQRRGDRIYTTLEEDRNGDLLLGSYGGLAVLHDDLRTTPVPWERLEQLEVSLLWADTAHRLWCSSLGALRSRTDGDWHTYGPAEGFTPVVVRSALARRDGSDWFGTAGRGIAVFRDGRFDSIGTRQGLSHLRVRGLYEDERGVVWAGTEGGGLARIELAAGEPAAKARVHMIRRRDGLLDDVVHAIVADDARRLWLSTNRGICCVPRDQLDEFARGERGMVAIRAFDEAHGMANRECNGLHQPAAMRASDGTLWFASQAGAAVIDPRAVPADTTRRAVIIEDVVSRGLRLPVRAGAVRIAPTQRVFSIAYACPEFLAPQQMRFRYRLRGNGDEWIEAGERRVAYFTEASPGRHTFEVSASSGGPWSPPTRLRVEIEPRWFETLAFRLGVLLALLGGAYAAYRWRLRGLVERERELSREVAARTAELREADAAKTRFFANISHEFRTPLTLTIGPLEDLLGGFYGSVQDEAREPLEMALRNSNRALAQVNRLLELARLEGGGMKLHAVEADLGHELREMAAPFAPLARRRGIALDVQVHEGVAVWCDRGLLEQAIANLLANALKFTPAGGHVTLAGRGEGAGDTARYVIAVRDDGPGIAPEEQPRLFERFYQASGAREVTRPGTGIGLSLARDIVELHGGTIELDSAPGAGSTFTVRLPLGRAHLRDEQVADTAPVRVTDGGASWLLADAPVEGALEVSAGAGADTEGETDAPTVLVVEDDAEVRGYLRQHLVKRYRVIEAGDGAAALDAARKRPPDLVISDVMMPVMDGFAFVEALQREPDLAGTPVVLLTARATFEDKLAGLSLGAVDYLAKPFHAAELLLRVRNLLAAQHRLRERLRPRELHAAPVEVTSEGDRFLARVREAVEQHMGEEDFDVERLAHEVGLSRSHLYRRLRELLDDTPEMVLRRMRLERAAQLLDQGAGSVSEIAYATGFKTVAWFCRVFREKYGTTPGAWAKRARG
ncbi:MAG: ATP-binding protein [Candidatus Eisenbacteria bacterium]